MAFNIGDRVRVKRYDEIPQTFKAKRLGGDPHLWNNGKARSGGNVGEVVDKLYSEAYECNVYKVRFDGKTLPSHSQFTDDCIEYIRDGKTRVSIEIDVTDDMVTVNMCRQNDDGKKVSVASGHGYIYSEDLEGIAQAASYACKMLWRKTTWHKDEEGKEE